MKKLLTPLLIISLLILLQGCANNRTVSEGDLLYSIMNTKSFPDGSYKGELKDGYAHGKGTLTYTNGDIYIGEMRLNSLWGKGTLTQASGAKYVGEFINNTKEGTGTYTYVNGNKYVGEWKNDKKHGNGTFTYSDGDKYEGGWKDDWIYGEGAFTYSDGDKLIVEVKTGQKTNGTYTYADGRKYQGEIKDRSPHGKGTMTFPDGTVKSGIWDDGKYLYDLAEQQEREKQKREAQLAAKKQRILSKLKPYMEDCQNIGFKVDTKKYRECIVESI